MKEKDLAHINTLVPPAANVVVLQAEEYNAVLSRIQQLQRLLEIYIGPDMSILNEPANSDWVEAIRKRRERMNDYGARIADLEARIEDLEKRPAKKAAPPGKKTEQRMLKIAITLVNRKNQPISYVDISKLLELGSRSADGKRTTRKQNMNHLGKQLEAAQDRFIVKADNQGHKYAHLTKIYYDHLVKEYLG